MNEIPEGIAGWLEEGRRAERGSAAVLSVLGVGGGVFVFLLMTLLFYTVLYVLFGGFRHPVRWLSPVALGLTVVFFAHNMKSNRDRLDLGMDPMGFWIIKDICSFGPRLLVEGLRQVRRCGELGELNVAACARALAYLAGQNAAVDWEELMRHCAQLSSARLREQLSLLHEVLFLGENASRVLLMEPFRLRLRSMLEREQRTGRRPEPARPTPEAPPRVVQVTDPEKLSAYELLGLSPSASMMEIKMAYRKRVKACHPDHFAGMDERAKAMAQRWTTALNGAYASLNPRQRGARPGSEPQG
jgi:DnaJ-domain-containing protein 1